MSDLQRRMELARKKLTEFKATDPSGDVDAADNVFGRYGQMEALLELLVEAYDAERCGPGCHSPAPSVHDSCPGPAAVTR